MPSRNHFLLGRRIARRSFGGGRLDGIVQLPRILLESFLKRGIRNHGLPDPGLQKVRLNGAHLLSSIRLSPAQLLYDVSRYLLDARGNWFSTSRVCLDPLRIRYGPRARSACHHTFLTPFQPALRTRRALPDRILSASCRKRA